MTPNNNLSILPFYEVTSANPTPRHDQKWWAYGEVWPLVFPVGTGAIPPIQVQGTLQPRVTLKPVWPNASTASIATTLTINTKVINGETYSYYDGLNYLGVIGRWYLETMIDGRTAISDVLTIIPQNQINNYLKLEWWDDNDLIMDAGALIYTNAYGVQNYKNRLYLPTDLAKPDYIFEEEGENRDGYFFPIKQISEKRYRFRFLAPEYILDVMRFIRMSDHIKITYRGQEYYPDTFLMTPTWEGDGYLANVECEFDTNTVAKKIGRLIANN